MSRKSKRNKQAKKKKRYSSDLSRGQWKDIRRFFFKKETTVGRPNKYCLKEILNAIFYLLHTGCQWRELPKDLPRWQSVYYHFRKWQRTGLIEEIHTFLRNRARKRLGREESPSLGAIDSQSVKASDQTENTGYDAGKKVKGVKTHIIVDCLGMLLRLCVLPADIQDRDGAKILLDGLKEQYPRLKKVNADSAYGGQLEVWTSETQGFDLEIVKKKEKGFKLLPQRYFVERTFSWLLKNRRLSKCYERLHTSMEAFVLLSMVKLLLNRSEYPEEQI